MARSDGQAAQISQRKGLAVLFVIAIFMLKFKPLSSRYAKHRQGKRISIENYNTYGVSNRSDSMRRPFYLSESQSMLTAI